MAAARKAKAEQARARAEQARMRREAAREAAEERRRTKRKELRDHAAKRANPHPTGPSGSAAVSPASIAAGGIAVSEIDVNAVPALSREGLRRVQTALKDRGFEPGPLNGAPNPQLNEAVRSFQTRYGIDARGVIDNQTLLALGEVSLASQPSR